MCQQLTQHKKPGKCGVSCIVSACRYHQRAVLVSSEAILCLCCIQGLHAVIVRDPLHYEQAGLHHHRWLKAPLPCHRHSLGLAISLSLGPPAHGPSKLFDELRGDTNAGLTPAEAKERLQVYGSNDLGNGAGVQPAKVLLRQVANAMTLVTCTITTYDRRETVDPLAYRCSSWLWP
jgi:hypothetical protein